MYAVISLSRMTFKPLAIALCASEDEALRKAAEFAANEATAHVEVAALSGEQVLSSTRY